MTADEAGLSKKSREESPTDDRGFTMAKKPDGFEYVQESTSESDYCGIPPSMFDTEVVEIPRKRKKVWRLREKVAPDKSPEKCNVHAEGATWVSARRAACHQTTIPGKKKQPKPEWSNHFNVDRDGVVVAMFSFGWVKVCNMTRDDLQEYEKAEMEAKRKKHQNGTGTVWTGMKKDEEIR
eukprot:757611-Pyramimonas_sp.AAC.1